MTTPWCPSCGLPLFDPKVQAGDVARCPSCHRFGTTLPDEPDPSTVWSPDAFRPVTVLQMAVMLAAIEVSAREGPNRSTARLAELTRLLVEGALEPPRRS